MWRRCVCGGLLVLAKFGRSGNFMFLFLFPGSQKALQCFLFLLPPSTKKQKEKSPFCGLMGLLKVTPNLLWKKRGGKCKCERKKEQESFAKEAPFMGKLSEKCFLFAIKL